MSIRTPTIRLLSLGPTLRPQLRSERVGLAAGVVASAALTILVARRGLSLEVVGVFGLAVFVGLVAAFVSAPWRVVPIMIPLFAVLPTLKVFVTPTIGAVKDVVSFAAVAAAAVVLARRHAERQPLGVDNVIMLLLGGLFALYVVNAGGLLTGETGHGVAWFQGVRLFFEPLALFVVGLALRQPGRTLRTALASLVATAVVVAAFGIYQQQLGVARLMSIGYTYGVEVRQINGALRSFGTLGEPFTYASFLLFALAVLLLRRRRMFGFWPALIVIGVGLYYSYVRTADLILLALIGLALARRGRTRAAAVLLVAAVLAASVFFASAAEQTSTRNVNVTASTYVTLNGRTKVWREQLGHPADWFLGRGVGAVGTAAQRAHESFTGKQQLNTLSAGGTVVDSGYLALIADVGILGLILFICFFGRVVMLAARYGRAGPRTAWIAQGLVLVMMVDALSRESFTAFPTAYLGMLLAGISVAAAREGKAS